MLVNRDLVAQWVSEWQTKAPESASMGRFLGFSAQELTIIRRGVDSLILHQIDLHRTFVARSGKSPENFENAYHVTADLRNELLSAENQAMEDHVTEYAFDEGEFDES